VFFRLLEVGAGQDNLRRTLSISCICRVVFSCVSGCVLFFFYLVFLAKNHGLNCLAALEHQVGAFSK
jgi:hypothetical protein